MHLKLNLDNHCVETEIRRLYNARVGECLAHRRGSAEDEALIELLKNMLETIDFPSLRSSWKELSGGPGRDAMLVLEDDSRVWIEINNKRINMDGPWERRIKAD